MLIIQHRANDFSTKAFCKSAEIDVQIDHYGHVVIGHDLWGETVGAEHFLRHTKFEMFLIDIKQNLSIEQLKKITKVFAFRSLGLIDVPFPSTYYARKAGLEIWARHSEFEPLNRLFDKFWVDPLASQHGLRILSLLEESDHNHEMIVASPELHGASESQAVLAWCNLSSFNNKTLRNGQMVGLVTKFPQRAEEFFNAS